MSTIKSGINSFSENQISIGDGVVSDKLIRADIGSGSNNPGIKYDGTTGTWKMANLNEPLTWKDLVTSIGHQNVLYVDGYYGNDDTAERGNFAKPYLTIGSALSAAQSGDTILVGPGTYAETLTIPEVDSINIIGAGTSNTIIETSSVGYVVSIAPTSHANQECIIADLTIGNTGDGNVLLVDGYNVDGYYGVFITGGLTLRNVTTRASSLSAIGLFCRCTGGVTLDNFTQSGLGSIEFYETNYVFVQNSSLSVTYSWGGPGVRYPDYTHGAPVEFTYTRTIEIYGSTIGILSSFAQAKVRAIGSKIAQINATTSYSAGISGIVNATGSYIDEIIIDHDMTGTSYDWDVADVSTCTINDITITRSGGTYHANVIAKDSCITNTIDIGAGCDVDLTSSSFNLDNLTIGSDSVVLPTMVPTPIGGLAILTIWGNESVTCVKGQPLGVCSWWVDVANETRPNQISPTSISLNGITTLNSDMYRIYLSLFVSGGNQVVDGYKDSARTQQVCTGTIAGNTGGPITLTQVNTSGVTGSITTTGPISDDFTAYLTVGGSSGYLPVTTNNATADICGVAYSGGSIGERIWMVERGIAEVIVEANGAVATGYICTSEDTTDAIAVWRTTNPGSGRVIGVALERKTTLTTVLVKTLLSFTRVDVI